MIRFLPRPLHEIKREMQQKYRDLHTEGEELVEALKAYSIGKSTLGKKDNTG